MKKLRKPTLNNTHTGAVLILIMFLVGSCSTIYKQNSTPLFELSYPKNKAVKWISKSDFDGIFVINDIDTAYYNFGYNVSTLAEKIPELVILDDMKDEEIKRIAESNLDKRFSNIRNSDVDRLRRQNLLFVHHNSQVWKYSKPIDTSIGGIIGIYIDSLLVDTKGIVRFNFYFKCVKKLSYSDANAIISSIKMRDDNIQKTDFYPTNIID